MPLSCSSWSILRSLLFPLLPGAMWWLQVSAHGRGSEPDLVRPRCLTPSPFLPRGLSPHVLTPSSGTTASARRGKGQVPKGGFAVGVGHLLAIWRTWGTGVGLPIVRAQPLPAQAPASASLPTTPMAVSILGSPAAVITAGVEHWVESSVFPYAASSRVTSEAHRETQPPRRLTRPGGRTVHWLAAWLVLITPVTPSETWELPLPPLLPLLLPAQSSDPGVPHPSFTRSVTFHLSVPRFIHL